VGGLDEALEVAMVESNPSSEKNVLVLICLRAAKARVLTLRGHAAQVASSLDWLESSTRRMGSEIAIMGLGSAAFARAGLGQGDSAVALLTEVEAASGAREVVVYGAYLPAMVRTALGIGDSDLADRLVSGFKPRYPLAAHALVEANAALTEDQGDLQAAADAYADAADRWEGFGVVPEQGFALLGQGRCLLGLAQPKEAVPLVRHAREIFERLQAAPALAETDELLQRATGLSS
jgi:hypothetical protein